MKVIDLLNKISNGEEVPKKIKYLIYEYTYNDDDEEYQRNQKGTIFGLGEDRRLDIVLCDEVEIIKEDKKIRKLDFIEENTFSKRQNGMTSEDRRLLDSNFKEIGNKINEIIDYLEEKE